MGRKKLTIVGAGNVGAAAAHWAALRGMADIVLIDVVEGLAAGKALDLAEAAPLAGTDVRIVGTTSYEEAAGSDVVIITAGATRRPGMSRDDLLQTNLAILRSVVEGVRRHAPGACLLVVSNPVDVMTYAAWKLSGSPTHRVVGQAGVLDSARFRAFLAWELGISVEDVSALVLGGHGDTMVPLVRYAYAGGIPIEKLLPRERIDAIVERTRYGGGEIVNLLKTSAYYAPGAAAVEMAEAILTGRRRILPAIAYLDGEYGQRDIYVGVPVVLGDGGVERVIEIDLTPEEQEAFARSVEAVRASLRGLSFDS